MKTVGEAEQRRELQTLTRSEKEGRRKLTSLIMFVAGFILLSATLLILTTSSCVAVRLD